MSLNIANVDKLLAFMRALPPEHFSMRLACRPSCKTPGCIGGCGKVIFGYVDYQDLFGILGIRKAQGDELCEPVNYYLQPELYPLARAIDVVQHLRDTGEVDWARFPAEDYRQPPAAPKLAWTPPVVIAVEPAPTPALPESLTSILRQPVEAIDAG